MGNEKPSCCFLDWVLWIEINQGGSMFSLGLEYGDTVQESTLNSYPSSVVKITVSLSIFFEDSEGEDVGVAADAIIFV
jgi:hypothetical protein